VEPFSESELKLVASIGAVLDSRYRMIVDATHVEQRFELFRGLPEDRHVSAFVDGAPYAQRVWEGPDRVEDAIKVLRTSSLSAYETRRISTDVLLFGKDQDPCHEVPVTPSGALRYSPALNSIRSFHRLCDGLQTLSLVDKDGFLVEIIDVEGWALPFSDTELPVPSPSRYHTHSAATLCGGHVVGKQVSPREALLQPTPCRSHSWNATDEAEEARRVAARKRHAKERDEDSNYRAALQRDPSVESLVDRSAAAGNRWCVS
jgi:hypothetical protein